MLADVEAHHREIVVWFGTIAAGLLLRLVFLYGDFEDEAGALLIVGVVPDIAAKELGDDLADREAETYELYIVAHLAEGVEDMFATLGGYATTGIGDAGANHIIILGAGHGDDALIGVLDGVFEKMAKQRLKGFLIGFNNIGVGQIGLEEHAHTFLALRTERVDHVAADVVGREGVVDGQRLLTLI